MEASKFCEKFSSLIEHDHSDTCFTKKQVLIMGQKMYPPNYLLIFLQIKQFDLCRVVVKDLFLLIDEF